MIHGFFGSHCFGPQHSLPQQGRGLLHDQLQRQLQSRLSCSIFGHFTLGLLSLECILFPIYILPQAPAVRMVDSATHWIKHHLLEKSIGFARALSIRLSGIHPLNNWDQVCSLDSAFYIDQIIISYNPSNLFAHARLV